MKSISHDFLIVGQGLAGSILANKLVSRGFTVLVTDNHHHASASTVAAGIINPISGKRLSLGEEFLPQYQTALSYYRQLEQQFDTDIVKSISQQRLICDAQQLEYFERRLQQADYQPFIGDRLEASPHFRNAEFGVLSIAGTLEVNTNSVLSAIKQWLISKDAYFGGKLDYRELGDGSNGYHLGDLAARQIIFCEGWQATQNPWLKNLPFNLAKGEILSVELKDSPLPHLLNWGNWLLPNAKGDSAKLGATFDRQNLDLSQDAQAQQALLDGLHANTTLSVSISSGVSGIRPATKSRNPFVGALSNLPNAYCFNGFGSKGCLMIPYYADLLCEHLLTNKPLPEKVTQWL